MYLFVQLLYMQDRSTSTTRHRFEGASYRHQKGNTVGKLYPWSTGQYVRLVHSCGMFVPALPTAVGPYFRSQQVPAPLTILEDEHGYHGAKSIG